MLQDQSATQVAQTQEQIQQQAALSAEQYQQQQRIYIDTRRAQLLETIYGRRDCANDDIEDCPFVSSVRVRAEAAKAFTKLEWEVGVRPDLSNIDLNESDFLADTVLVGAVFSETILSTADLVDANLFDAYLRNANLTSAKYTVETIWPEGFDPKTAGAILIKWNTDKREYVLDRLEKNPDALLFQPVQAGTEGSGPVWKQKIYGKPWFSGIHTGIKPEIDMFVCPYSYMV